MCVRWFFNVLEWCCVGEVVYTNSASIYLIFFLVSQDRAAAAARLVTIFHVCCSTSSMLVGILLPLALNSRLDHQWPYEYAAPNKSGGITSLRGSGEK